MSVYNQYATEALSVQRVHDVSKDSALCVVSCVHTERQFTLPRILRTHCHRGHHHRQYTILFSGQPCSIHCNVVCQDAVGHVGQVQIVRLRGTPRQQHHLIIAFFRHAIRSDGQIKLTDILFVGHQLIGLKYQLKEKVLGNRKQHQSFQGLLGQGTS